MKAVQPLFVQLDEFFHSHDSNEYGFWREKARYCLGIVLINHLISIILKYRWIKFEETAEDVLGRWSKPHVATVAQTSIEDLNNLIKEGVILLDSYIMSIEDMAGIKILDTVKVFS